MPLENSGNQLFGNLKLVAFQQAARSIPYLKDVDARDKFSQVNSNPVAGNRLAIHFSTQKRIKLNNRTSFYRLLKFKIDEGRSGVGKEMNQFRLRIIAGTKAFLSKSDLGQGGKNEYGNEFLHGFL